MVKLYPALLLPALLGRRPWTVLVAFAGFCLAVYAPHVLAVGPDVLGYLPGYLREEDYVSGTRYLLLRPFGLTGTPASVVAVGLLAAVVAVVVRRRPVGEHVGPALCALLGSALLIATPVQPWYAVALVALAALAGRPEWLAVAAAAYPLFFGVIPGGPTVSASRTGEACFGVALVLVLLAARRRRARGPGRPDSSGNHQDSNEAGRNVPPGLVRLVRPADPLP